LTRWHYGDIVAGAESDTIASALHEAVPARGTK
jgi:hypothetical protein